MPKDISNVSISQSQLDKNGLVYLWLIDKKDWTKRMPIDAREMIAAGEANLTGPKDQESGESSKPEPADHEAALAELSKPALRDLCMKNKAPFVAADTKRSLVQKLLDCGVVPQ